MTSHEIRKAFLDFFASKQHKIVPSAPLVLKNDPTLMFTNSGMVQFKDYFLGNGTPPSVRIADTQKCLRVSGKHNDLEDVGFDGTHHTMFEMLGNWSFGDYFKKEAIAWSWELLHDKLGLPADRLYATVFGGDEKDGLASDEEARNFWRQYLPDNQILDGNKKDNFWEMGAQGPCGPCSEIHFDFRSDVERAKVAGEKLVNQDDPSVVEIWNNVFMQFERKTDGSLVVLPAQHVDTGMGFERLCMVLQGKKYTYDTDIFTPFIQLVEQESGKKYTGSYDRNAKTDVAMRVIVDHIRAVAFTIADGQLPASNGAGYVIRRILRRAVRYYYSFLDIKEPLLNKLIPLLATEFQDVFPELKAQQEFVQKVILEEERSFLRTLELGLKRFETLNTEGGIVKGAEAFEMFDTYGFPIDLTELIANEKGLSVDTAGFNTALIEQKQRSKKDAEKQVGDWVTVIDEAGVEFVGYDQLKVENAKVLKYRAVTDKKGLQYQIVLNRTPFYAESGGQVGDTGAMYFDGEKIAVLDTKKENDLIIHIVNDLPENINDPRVRAQVDKDARQAISQNHTATHLMHAALHQILGKHAVQKGQNVDDKRLRFDFSHYQGVSKEELAQIEDIVNDKICENIALNEVRNMPIEDAKKTGAMMLFGEKYGETVRVITFDKSFSQELCGGTHVQATGEIGYFKIISEAAVAAGVRRIEALTALSAFTYIRTELEELSKIRAMLKNPRDLPKAVIALQEDINNKKKKIQEHYDRNAKEILDSTNWIFEEVKGFNLIVREVEIDNAETVKMLASNLEKKERNAIVLLAVKSNDKLNLTLKINDDIVKTCSLHAGHIIQKIAKGGGQPNFASGSIDLDTTIDSLLGKLTALLPDTCKPLPKTITKILNHDRNSSVFSKAIFEKLIRDEFSNHIETQDWLYFKSQSSNFLRKQVLKQGQADFNEKFEVENFILTPSDLVELYSYYYMQMHFESSLGLYYGILPLMKRLITDKNLLFIDLGCGPFTSGLALLDFCEQNELKDSLNMFYIGYDPAENMISKAECILSEINDSDKSNQFRFTTDIFEIGNYSSEFEQKFKNHQKRTSIIINLCYVMASPYFEWDNNLEDFANRINELINKYANESICILYQNPNKPYFRKNWEKLKQKIQFGNLIERKGVISFTFNDLVGSFARPKPNLEADYEYYFNEII